MLRVLPLLAAIGVVLGTGLVHGLWTARWQPAPEIGLAVARLERVPDHSGLWKGKPAKEDAEAFEQARAAGWRVRQFSHPRHGSFLVILMCGRAGPMSVHRPEHCYRGAGFEISSAPVHGEIEATRGTSAEYWTARFVREEETATTRLRIFWTWFDGARWLAPGSPRFTFAHLPALYKLYVIRDASGTNEAVEEKIAKDFLRQLLPELSAALAAP